MKKIVVKKNETIFESGAKADSVYLIVSGEIGIFLPTNNSDKPDFILGENEIFGEMGVIDKSLRAGRADALSDANLIKISQYEFNDKLSKSDPFITGLTRVLVTRIRGLLKKTTTKQKCNKFRH
ncbi:MAG: hypothetical protein CM15mP117_06820 [Alphaproteobacteria bacterium]|nr:MAG: hypothetical protein CM15mP117_06820 [Alphaproteobacteria bacterium]